MGGFPVYIDIEKLFKEVEDEAEGRMREGNLAKDVKTGEISPLPESSTIISSYPINQSKKLPEHYE